MIHDLSLINMQILSNFLWLWDSNLSLTEIFLSKIKAHEESSVNSKNMVGS